MVPGTPDITPHDARQAETRKACVARELSRLIMAGSVLKGNNPKRLSSHQLRKAGIHAIPVYGTRAARQGRGEGLEHTTLVVQTNDSLPCESVTIVYRVMRDMFHAGVEVNCGQLLGNPGPDAAVLRVQGNVKVNMYLSGLWPFCVGRRVRRCPVREMSSARSHPISGGHDMPPLPEASRRLPPHWPVRGGVCWPTAGRPGAEARRGSACRQTS